MIEIVTNRCFGGFGLSNEAEELYAQRSGFDIFRYNYERSDDNVINFNKMVRIDDQTEDCFSHTYTKDFGPTFCKDDVDRDDYYWMSSDIQRDDPLLVKIVKELGDKANGAHANLEVTEIPDGTDWVIDEYDGLERVEEAHRSW